MTIAILSWKVTDWAEAPPKSCKGSAAAPEKLLAKGQLISKANCQAVNSSKKQTNEFIFTTMWRVFVCFLEDIEDTKKPLEIT